MHDIHIKTYSCFAEIQIDGLLIPGVVSYNIEHKLGHLPVLHLEVIGNITIDSKMLAPLPEPWARFYKEPASHEHDTGCSKTTIRLDGEYLAKAVRGAIHDNREASQVRPE